MHKKGHFPILTIGEAWSEQKSMDIVFYAALRAVLSAEVSYKTKEAIHVSRDGGIPAIQREALQPIPCFQAAERVATKYLCLGRFLRGNW